MDRTMDRKIIIALAALTLAFASLAQARMERIEEAYELDLTQVSLPAHATDKVMVKPCAGCFTVQLQADDGTSYYIGFRSPAVTLQELTAAVDAVRDRENTPIYVMFQPETLVVTRIILDTASR